MKYAQLGSGLLLVLLTTSLSTAQDTQVLNILTLTPPDSPIARIQADVIANFEKQTGATVKVTTSTDDTPEVFETSVVGGKEADVVFVNLNEGSLDWVKNGIAVPSDQYLDAWGLRQKINPVALKEWTSADGKTSGFPYNGFVWPVWYNMDLLAKAGVAAIPTTTDDLIAAAAKLRAAGIAPVVVGGNDWSGQKMFLQIVQSYMSPDETRAVYAKGNFCSDPKAMKGLELFVKLRDAGVFVDDVEGYTADQMNATFYEGKAAIMSAGSWAFTDAPTDKMKIELGGFPVPADGTYAKPTAMSGWTGSGFWISNNGAKKLDLVQKYISAWYEPAIAARVVSEANSPTAALIEGQADIRNPLLAYASTKLGGVVDFAVMPDTAVPGAVANPMIRQTSLAFAAGNDAASICAGLEEAYAQ